jgi:hypothetical protein
MEGQRPLLHDIFIHFFATTQKHFWKCDKLLASSELTSRPNVNGSVGASF